MSRLENLIKELLANDKLAVKKIDELKKLIAERETGTKKIKEYVV
jgi:hypothetical protein